MSNTFKDSFKSSIGYYHKLNLCGIHILVQSMVREKVLRAIKDAEKAASETLSDAKKEAAFAWLRNKGHGDLIKNQVSCSFGRDEDEKARGLIDTLNEKGYPSSQREWVEPSTLRAFIREQHEAGKELPMDLLGAFVGQKTTIKN